MVSDCFELFEVIFYYCSLWLNKLLSAVDGGRFVLVGFCIYVVVQTLLMPLRGSSLVVPFNTISEFSYGMIHKGERWNGKWTLGLRRGRAKGQFEEGNKSSKLDRKAKHNSYKVFKG